MCCLISKHRRAGNIPSGRWAPAAHGRTTGHGLLAAGWASLERVASLTRVFTLVGASRTSDNAGHVGERWKQGALCLPIADVPQFFPSFCFPLLVFQLRILACFNRFSFWDVDFSLIFFFLDLSLNSSSSWVFNFSASFPFSYIIFFLPSCAEKG